MKAMILAAGRGERMRPLTDSRPKALLEAGDKPLIEHHLTALAAAGVRDVVINLAWLGEQIRSHLGSAACGVAIEYSDEGDSALETGGGIAQALPLLGDEPFWLVNGDVYTDYAFGPGDLAATDLGHLVLVANPEHNPGGDFGLEAGRVRDAEKKYTFSGISLLSPGLLDGHTPGKFPLAPLLRDALKRDALSGELHDGVWIDVGTPERLAQVDELIRSGG